MVAVEAPAAAPAPKSAGAKKPKSKTVPAAPRPVAEPVPVQPPVIKVEPAHRQPSATAVRVFEQAIKVFHKRQFAEARALFENLLAKYPHEVEILARASTYIHVCDQRLAHEERLPRNPEEFYDRGVFALNTGNYEQARVCFEKARKIKPEEPHILYSLAATLVHLGEVEQALIHLQRSIQLQPRYRSQVLNDNDFSDLRDNRQFLAMMGMTSPFDRFETRR
ncbi:MAG: tetratricopeptide repeat protein [Acidobacteriota bacterium]